MLFETRSLSKLGRHNSQSRAHITELSAKLVAKMAQASAVFNDAVIYSEPPQNIIMKATRILLTSRYIAVALSIFTAYSVKIADRALAQQAAPASSTPPVSAPASSIPVTSTPAPAPISAMDAALVSAEAAIDSGNWSKAVDLYDIILEESPANWQALNNRGFALHELKQYPRALKDFDRAIELKPNYGVAFNNRGRTWSEMGNDQKAIEDYTEALKINPKSTAALTNRGRSYGNIASYKQAFQNYSKALKLDAKFAPAYYSRALTNEKMGKVDASQRDLAKAKELQK